MLDPVRPVLKLDLTQRWYECCSCGHTKHIGRGQIQKFLSKNKSAKMALKKEGQLRIAGGPAVLVLVLVFKIRSKRP